MPSRAAQNRAKVTAEHPGASLIKKGRRTQLFDIGGGKRRAIMSIQPRHYLLEDGDWAEIDTDWVATPDGTHDYECVKNSVHMRMRSDIAAVPLEVINPGPAGGSFIFYPHALRYVDADGGLDQIAMPTGTTTPTENTIRWNDAYGTGIHFEWINDEASLMKRLIIEQPLRPPAQFVIDKGLENAKIELNFGMKITDLDLFIDTGSGYQPWDKKTKTETIERVEVRQTDGETLWALERPFAEFVVPGVTDPAEGEEPVDGGDPIQWGSIALSKKGANLFFTVRFPYLWLEDAEYPIIIDPSLTYDLPTSGKFQEWYTTAYFDFWPRSIAYKGSASYWGGRPYYIDAALFDPETSITQGIGIVSARLKGKVGQRVGTEVYSTFRLSWLAFEDTDDAAHYSTVAGVNDVALTEAVYMAPRRVNLEDWPAVNTWVDLSFDQYGGYLGYTHDWDDESNIASILQRVVDRPGFSTSSNIALYTGLSNYGTASTYVRFNDLDLDVVYMTSSGPPSGAGALSIYQSRNYYEGVANKEWLSNYARTPAAGWIHAGSIPASAFMGGEKHLILFKHSFAHQTSGYTIRLHDGTDTIMENPTVAYGLRRFYPLLYTAPATPVDIGIEIDNAPTSTSYSDQNHDIMVIPLPNCPADGVFAASTVGSSSRTAETFTTMDSLTFTPATSGVYVVLAAAPFEGTGHPYHRIRIDGTNEMVVDGYVNGTPQMACWVGTLDATEHTVLHDVQTNSASATVPNSSIVAFRLDMFSQYYYEFNEADSSQITATQYQGIMVAHTWSPTIEEGRYIILAYVKWRGLASASGIDTTVVFSADGGTIGPGIGHQNSKPLYAWDDNLSLNSADHGTSFQHSVNHLGASPDIKIGGVLGYSDAMELEDSIIILLRPEFNVSATTDQEGFQWKDDDAADGTDLAAQDVDITRPTNQNTRVRVLVDRDTDWNDISEQYKIQYKRDDEAASEWRDI